MARPDPAQTCHVRVLLLALLYLAMVDPLIAADCRWSGENGDWSDPTQWSDCGGGVPGDNDTAIIEAGTVTLQATTTVSRLTMTGGTLIGSGLGMSLTVSDNLVLSGESPKRIARMTLNNAGTAVWDGGLFTLGPWPDPVNFNNLAGASFEIVGERTLQHSAGSALLNDGTIVKTGPGFSDLAFLLGVRNNGLIRVDEGVLRINGTRSIPVEVYTHSGDFVMLAGATMQFDGTQNYGPSASITGEGNVGFIRNGGTHVLDWDMTYAIGGRTTVSCFACAVRFHANAITGELALLPWEGQFPQIEGEGTLTVTGQTLWSQGVIGHTGNYFNNGPITIDMQGGLSLSGSGSHLASDAIIRNHGAAVYNAGSFFLRHPSARFINLPGASFEIAGPRDIDFYWGGQDVPLGRFVNQGEVIKTGSGEAFFTGVILDNSGSLDVQEGSLAFRRSSAVNSPDVGGRLILAEGLTSSDVPLNIEASSWLLGSGAVDGPVAIRGHISPGHPGFGGTPWAAARITVNGDMNLDLDGRYLAKLLDGTTPGDGHDQIAVKGTAFIEGRLAISLQPDYDPPMGTEFTLLSCSLQCTGSFQQISFSPPQAAFEVIYEEQRIVARRLPDRIFRDAFITINGNE